MNQQGGDVGSGDGEDSGVTVDFISQRTITPYMETRPSGQGGESAQSQDHKRTIDKNRKRQIGRAHV